MAKGPCWRRLARAMMACCSSWLTSADGDSAGTAGLTSVPFASPQACIAAAAESPAGIYTCLSVRSISRVFKECECAGKLYVCTGRWWPWNLAAITSPAGKFLPKARPPMLLSIIAAEDAVMLTCMLNCCSEVL